MSLRYVGTVRMLEVANCVVPRSSCEDGKFTLPLAPFGLVSAACTLLIFRLTPLSAVKLLNSSWFPREV